MTILGLRPGPLVGQAYRYMLELRMERGPMDEQQARAALLDWWSDQQAGSDQQV
jgi:poly(A) polymerase